MARIRTIKPTFFTSLTIADLTVEQRLTFIGLWTHVDDEGRCVYDPRLIKAALWPLDDRTPDDIADDVRALTESSLITHYTVGERSYLHVNTWAEHQRINRKVDSKLPAPEDGQIVPLTSSDEDSLSTHGVVTEVVHREGKGKEGKGREGVARKRATSLPPTDKKGTRIPDNFSVTPEMEEWATGNTPLVNVQAELPEFVDYWRGVPGQKGVKLDWVSTWRNAMRRKQQWAEERGGGRPANGQRPGESLWDLPATGTDR